MIQTIQNEFLKVDVNTLGAELFSIIDKKDNQERLWQGNPEFWKGRATVLFPIVGRLTQGKYTWQGKEYEMPIHGFCKLSEFTVEEKSDAYITLSLKSNPETQKMYPFEFLFKVSYTLIDNRIDIKYNVTNTGSGDLPFSVGGHPGFNVPFSSDTFEDYYIEFSSPKQTRYLFSDTCFILNTYKELTLNDNKLNLEHNMFDCDAIFLKANEGKVYLKSSKHNRNIEVGYEDMTALGLWHKPKTQAPYICIEPWHGIPATDGIVDDFSTKQDFIHLPQNHTYTSHFYIAFNN